MRFTSFLTGCLITLCAATAYAEDGVTVKLGGTIFGEYTVSDPGTRPTSFQITRAYLNITGNVNPRVSFRFTPDIARETGNGSTLSGSQTYRLKYAYAQYTVDRWWIRAGVQQTPYLDFIESLYRFRFQGTLFSEREGFLTSSDTGVSAHYNLPNDRGDIHAGYYNGEGYSKMETNDYKALQVRATFRPLAGKGLRLTAFADFDHADGDRSRSRWIAHATYETSRGNAGLEFLRARDQMTSRGWSAWATPRLNSKVQALLRYDAMQSSDKSRDIVGVSYWFPTPKGTTAAILIDRDHSRAITDDTRYGAHLVLTF
jgi:hypothetical protein